MGGRKEVIATLFLMIFCVAIADAYWVWDDTGSDFIVEGCEVSGVGLEKDSCSRDGNFFCDENSVLGNTLLDNDACKMGKPTFATGDSQCCPAGYECDDDGTGNYTCNQRVAVCSGTDPASCTAIAGCFWISEENYCTDSPIDFSCSVYNNSNDCESDVWNLGSEGFGTEVCGGVFEHNMPRNNTVYVIPKSTCRCEWDSGSSECKLHYDVLPDVYGLTGEMDNVSCWKSFDVGICVDGQQDINWTAKSYDWNGNFSYPSAASHHVAFVQGHPSFAEDIKCMNSTTYMAYPFNNPQTTRSCGEKTIKLPGISTISILVAILSITLFYILREQRQK
jgi:hypothetical protein